MIPFRAFLLFGLGSCVVSLPVRSNTSCDEESLLTVPVEVLNQLTDIKTNSKGLLPLWKRANYLAKNHILTSEYQQLERKTCRGLMFNEVSTELTSCDDINSLTRNELAIYYNEFVIQLRVSEAILLGNIIEKEVQEKYRVKAEERMQQIIELLDEEILPILALMLNATNNIDANCSDTQGIVNNMISLYSDCVAVQTTNIYLAQTTLEFYRTLISIDGVDVDDNKDEVDKLDYYSDGQWCIIQ